MDVFKEQNVVRLQDSRDLGKKIIFGVTAVMIAATALLFTFGTMIMMLGLMITIGAVYLGYYLVTSLNIEYEYILTNGEVDFDKITAQRSRKRLISVKLNTAVDFGKVEEGKTIEDADTYVTATANDPELTDYYLRVKHNGYGDTVIYFTPSEDMITLMKHYFPRELRS
ncbi:MAG: hypothetical protein IKP47_04220 [Ruminococcus sp.]|nr:hypothetical protein [Ruminococcus sp.]